MTRNEEFGIALAQLEATIARIKRTGASEDSLAKLLDQAFELQQIAFGPPQVSPAEFYRRIRQAQEGKGGATPPERE